jgi:hypothetical protein
VFFGCYYIQKLSLEAGDILKDNYNSIVYARNMISALDDMRTSISGSVSNSTQSKTLVDYHSQLFESAKAEFETNLQAENNNITEIHEKEYVKKLNNDYAMYLGLSIQLIKRSGNSSIYFNEFLPAYEKVKLSINRIEDLNMQAVVRKNQATKHDSAKMITLMAAIGSFCIILAFGYFWYFPFYISQTISYLSDRMKELLKKIGIAFDIKTNDETHVILHAINLLENKLDLKPAGKENNLGATNPS